jgi:hypothetical protein
LSGAGGESGGVTDYRAFLERKAKLATSSGFEVSADEINPILKPHQNLSVRWAVRGGRRALFHNFGLGKTIEQLEIVRLILERAGGRGLITCPLGVRQEFRRDAIEKLGWSEPPRFIRRIEEADETGIYLTNYETVREQKLDPRGFTVVSLDEGAVLRGFGGTKTFREFIRVFEGTSTYRFVATATPDPNEYIELLSYAAFLDVMDVGQAKTRWFKRDSTKADELTLHPHKEKEFWLWVASWALFLYAPSDLGFSDEGYVLPELDVRWHEVASDHAAAAPENDGQGRMFKDSSLGVSEASREKRASLPARLAKLMELRAEDPGVHRILWHDLEDERAAIEQAIPTAVSVYGSQDLDKREQAVIDFSDGKIAELTAKPVVAGAGCNFQRHCAWAIYLGVGFKFHDFIQSLHRLHRFLQTKRVRADIIYSEAERPIRKVLEGKWQRHNEQTARMRAIVRDYGMAQGAMAQTLRRSIGVEREVVTLQSGAFTGVLNDCVEELPRLEANSVDLIVTSIPFATQYEYTPTYNDFGHSESNAQFWQQMDFLTPELLRVLQPGRVMVIHVKDRIVPSGMLGLGFQTVAPLHAEAITHYQRHGFGYLGMKTIVTDVVRENNQTYRLGYSEQCKDGSRMGCGMPEYLLLFRKPPTDRSNGYADIPVVKSKDSYSLGRWQLDAHGFTRSNGNRFLSCEDLDGVAHDVIYRLFKRHSLSTVYDADHHARLAEALEARRRLPVTFMLLPPHSWHPDVWTDVARMRTLNTMQEAKGREMHLCPLQFDIVDRLITQLSMPGELVLDPFAGLFTVPYRAVRLKRRAYGIELSPTYFADGVRYVDTADQQADVPTLFDLVAEEAEAVA